MSKKDDEAAAYYEDPAHRMSDGHGHPMPGRPSRLSSHTPVRFDAETIAAIRRFSDDDGMTVSAWVRHLVNREIKRRTSLLTRTGFAGGTPPRISFDVPGRTIPGTLPTVVGIHDLRALPAKAPD